MAQVIKIKRGGLANLVANTPTLVQGELLLATGSLNGLKSTFFVASASDSPSLPYAKIESISNGPALGSSLDNNFEGLLIHSASDNKFYRYNGSSFVELPVAAGSFVGTLGVTNGGTGQSTLTDGAVLVGNGVSGIEQITLTNGQLLIGNTSNSPSAATLTAGGGIGIDNAAGSITIRVNSGSLATYFNSSSWAGVSGDILINASTGIATIQANSVDLGTDTTGNYVATIANATNGGTTINNGTGEGGAATIALNFGDLTEAAVAVGTDYIPFIDGGATGDSRKESIADLVSAVAGTQLVATAGVLSVPALTNLLLATSSYLKSASVIGTANEIEVTANGAQGIQIGLPNDVVIAGNLTVNGSTTTINSTAVEIGDRIIVLNGADAAGDAGILVHDTSTNQTGSLLWDTTGNYWKSGLATDLIGGGTFFRLSEFAASNPTDNGFIHLDGNDRIVSVAQGVDGAILQSNGNSTFSVSNVIDGGTF